MADLQKIAEDLSGLTVLEASELSKMLEENGEYQLQHQLLLQHQLVDKLQEEKLLLKKKLNLQYI